MRAILTYHSIDSSGSPISIDRRDFLGHVEWFRGSTVRVVPLETLRELPPEDSAVALTFDDAFVNFAEEAWPVLRAAGLPVTLFVVAGAAGATNDWGGAAARGIPRLPLLDWSALRQLAAEGVTIGSHGCRHVDLTTVSERTVAEELAASGERLRAETGQTVRTLAYPYGACSPAVTAEARRHYDLAVTTRLSTLASGDDPHRLPRLDAWYLKRPGRLESFGTPRFRRYVRTRALLRTARHCLLASRPRRVNEPPPQPS